MKAPVRVRGLTQKNPGRWQHFAHGADIGIRGIGATKEAAFEQAALALTAVITDPSNVAARRMFEVQCEAADRETLLVDWLNALVYEMSVHGVNLPAFQGPHRGQSSLRQSLGRRSGRRASRACGRSKGRDVYESVRWPQRAR